MVAQKNFITEREKDGVLPFFDLSIKRLPTKLITKVYRKETHTQRYIHWRSNQSKNCKLGVLKGLVHRAHLLCCLEMFLSVMVIRKSLLKNYQ